MGHIRTIDRKLASSEKVSYSESIVIHETRSSRLVLVPFYIPRSAGTQLAIKLVTYKKSPPPADWAIIEEKSISMKEETARRLYVELKGLFAIAQEEEDGSYVLIRVTEGTAQIGTHDPAAVAAALTKVLSSEEIVKHLGSSELSEELINAFRGAIRLKEMRSAVATLREYLNNGEVSENIYQKWCEEHSWAFGNAYVMRDEARDISAGDRLDILLPTVISGYRDIVELKRPDQSALLYDEAHRNYYYSADVSRAIGQCHRYLDVLHEVAGEGLRDHPEIVAYHPRAIIVIGRSNDWAREKLKALHGLNRRLSGVTVMTYDQLLSQGERLVEILSHSPRDVEDEVDDLEVFDDSIDCPS